MLELELVKAFHQKYRIPILDDSSVVPMKRVRLRQTLLNEELRELIEADAIGEIQEIAKEAGDVVYVLLGTVLELGYYNDFKDKELPTPLKIAHKNLYLQKIVEQAALFQDNWSKKQLLVLLNILMGYLEAIGLAHHFQRIIAEVHRSNMSKGTNGQPLIRADGKILKGEDFRLADMSFLMWKIYEIFKISQICTPSVFYIIEDFVKKSVVEGLNPQRRL
jgi:predicted HAD superfamily Cof-like phosphohydrolase